MPDQQGEDPMSLLFKQLAEKARAQGKHSEARLWESRYEAANAGYHSVDPVADELMNVLLLPLVGLGWLLAMAIWPLRVLGRHSARIARFAFR